MKNYLTIKLKCKMLTLLIDWLKNYNCLELDATFIVSVFNKKYEDKKTLILIFLSKIFKCIA